MDKKFLFHNPLQSMKSQTVDSYFLSFNFFYMQLDSMKFSIAATSTVGLWYLICIIVVSIAPEMTIQLFGMMTHLINIDWMLENTKVTLTTGII